MNVLFKNRLGNIHCIKSDVRRAVKKIINVGILIYLTTYDSEACIFIIYLYSNKYFNPIIATFLNLNISLYTFTLVIKKSVRLYCTDN